MKKTFEYDPAKAAINLAKHGVSFEEATSILRDPLGSTLPDDQHSEEESRSSRSGSRHATDCGSWFTLSAAPASDSSVRVSLLRGSKNNMKKDFEIDPLAERPNLDFSKGVRGKYYERMQEGTNLVLIAPDLMDTFPDSEAVNEALRSLKTIAERTRKAS